MIALLQRVLSASVRVEGRTIGAIDAGLLALIGVVRGDEAAHAERLLQRLLDYRLFADAAGRMNLSLRQAGGGLLLVPQFTLAADTDRGNRASFTRAAAPAEAAVLFDHLLSRARDVHAPVAAGQFGAYMQVSLINDGPVTYWLETREA
ncbi:MAG TPA: D-aminoacyl-tRNA deacylase [Steroidobacteraceae bacterium]|jgi:D-tyrosyl-tRNA(Tyr) deacylase